MILWPAIDDDCNCKPIWFQRTVVVKLIGWYDVTYMKPTCKPIIQKQMKNKTNSVLALAIYLIGLQ